MPKMKGYEAVSQMLDGYGVTHVFMVPAVLRRTMVELGAKTAIRRIHCHGEKSAAYMADGYARASGKPGICMAQVIGALNLAAGLRERIGKIGAHDLVARHLELVAVDVAGPEAEPFGR